MTNQPNGVTNNGRGERATWHTSTGVRRVLILTAREERKRSHIEGKGKAAVKVDDEGVIVQAVAMVRRDGPVGQRSVVVGYAPVGELRMCPDVTRDEWPPEIWQEFGPPPDRIPDLDLDAGAPPVPWDASCWRPKRETGPERTDVEQGRARHGWGAT